VTFRHTIRSAEQLEDVTIRLLRGYIRENGVPDSGLEVTLAPPKRTNRQNAYLWGVVYKTLAEGMSEQAREIVKPKWVHELCKEHFMPRIDVPGTNKTVPMSTTELCRSGNEDSFQDYVTQIQALGAAKGIFIPDPNEGGYEY